MNSRFSTEPVFEDVLTGRRQIGRGEKGTAVQILQQVLADMGFPMLVLRNDHGVSGVDGHFGAQTGVALTNFQVHAAKSDLDVRPNGALDAATMKALDALAPEPGKTAWDKNSPHHAPVPVWKTTNTPLRVVVVKDEHRTFLFDKDGECTGIFPNAHGITGSDTDAGLKKVRTKLDEASAMATGRQLWKTERAFGKRILDLCWVTGKSHGEELHGTYDYRNMGKDVSHGCVRHYNEDIITIFDALGVGDFVAIVETVDDPRLAARANG